MIPLGVGVDSANDAVVRVVKMYSEIVAAQDLRIRELEVRPRNVPREAKLEEKVVLLKQLVAERDASLKSSAEFLERARDLIDRFIVIIVPRTWAMNEPVFISYCKTWVRDFANRPKLHAYDMQRSVEDVLGEDDGKAP